MKFTKFIILSLFSVSRLGWAQATCAPSSPEMAAYFTQKNWQSRAVTDPTGVRPVQGYVDPQNRFYFDDLTRTGLFEAKVKVDQANQSYRQFFKYCRDNRGNYLRAMRKGRENNRYAVSLRYLPELTGFANNPFADQNYKENAVNLKVEFKSDSTISEYEVFGDRVKNELNESLKRQLAAGTKTGLIELDLTGWDDVVCDIIQGKITLRVGRDALSSGPLVEQKKLVEPQDVQTIHQSLTAQIPATAGKESFLFQSGRIISKLEESRRIAAYEESKLFEILKRLTNAEMSRPVPSDRQALECAADQVQAYRRPVVQHVIDIQFKFPNLDEIKE